MKSNVELCEFLCEESAVSISKLIASICLLPDYLQTDKTIMAIHSVASKTGMCPTQIACHINEVNSK